MRCEQIQTEILDLDLDGQRRQRIAVVLAHLDECAACRSAFEEYDQLRALLRGPEADELAEPVGGWLALENRLRRRVSWYDRRRVIAPLGLAAALLLAVVGWSLYLGALSAHTSTAIRTQRGVALMGLTPQEVETGVKVFTQVSQVFDHRTDWVLISGRDSEVGLVSDRDSKVEPITRHGPTQGELLLLRLTVLKGQTPVSNADLVIVPGQNAEFKVPSAAGPEIRYRVATDKKDSGKMQLWVELARPNHLQHGVASLASELQFEPGQVRSAGEVVTASGRYEVNVGFERARIPESGL